MELGSKQLWVVSVIKSVFTIYLFNLQGRRKSGKGEDKEEAGPKSKE